MINVENLARDLNTSKEFLMTEGIRLFLTRKLLKIETELFRLSKKYGIKNIFEFDNEIEAGTFSEKIAYEDYFLFDNFEAEKDKIKKALQNL